MSTEDKLGGYASGFAKLDSDVIAANVTDEYRLLDRNGAVYEKREIPGYIADLARLGDQMEITDLMVNGGKAWCKWKVGNVEGSGLISFDADGVTEEQLFYL